MRLSSIFSISIVFAAVAPFAASASYGQTLHDVHSKAGIQCAACHQRMPPEPKPPDTACVACHGTMLTPAGRVPRSPDPHASPHLASGEVPACSECHHVHKPSEVTCVTCHRGFQFKIK
jgi:hypothetical protein